MSINAFRWPGLSWLEVIAEPHNCVIRGAVKHNGYTDVFEMDDTKIGEKGELFIKEAYLRRAKLIAIEKIAKELEK